MTWTHSYVASCTVTSPISRPFCSLHLYGLCRLYSTWSSGLHGHRAPCLPHPHTALHRHQGTRGSRAGQHEAIEGHWWAQTASMTSYSPHLCGQCHPDIPQCTIQQERRVFVLPRPHIVHHLHLRTTGSKCGHYRGTTLEHKVTYIRH